MIFTAAPRPSGRPTGLSIGYPSSFPGTRQKLSIVTAPAARPSHRTHLHRGVGGRPVGNNSGNRTNAETIAGTQTHVLSHAVTVAAAPPGSVWPAAMAQ